MMSDLSPEEIDRLSSIIDSINSIIKKLDDNEVNNFEALEEINKIVTSNASLLKKDTETYNEILDIEYAVAYNSLLDGIDPNQVKKHTDSNVWNKLEKDIPSIAESIIINSLLDNNLNEAIKKYNVYKDYLPDEIGSKLETLISDDFQNLVSAIRNQDEEKITKIIQKLINENKYQKYRDVYKEYYGVDLDDIKKTAITNYIYDLLSQAKTPHEALSILENAEKIAQETDSEILVKDLQHLVNSLDYAEKGEINSYIAELEQVRDQSLVRYGLAKGLNIIIQDHPESLQNIGNEVKDELENLIQEAGFNININDLIEIGKGVEIAVKLDDLISKGMIDKAFDLWNNLSQKEKEAVALILGKPVSEIGATLESLKYIDSMVDKANIIINLLENGKYLEAYNEWSKLKDNDKKTIAELLDTEMEKLDTTIRLSAGLQAVAQLQNPTIEQVKQTLAPYLGEEKAEEIAKELLESSPLYKMKQLADNRNYDKALEVLLNNNLDDEEKRIGVYYLLSAISKKETPETLAQFIEKHKEQLQSYLSEDILKGVEMVSQADVIAQDLIQTITEVTSEEYGKKLSELVNEYKSYLEAKQWDKAKELLVNNRELLGKAEINAVKLSSLLLELYTIARAGDILDRESSKLEDLANNISNNPGDVIREADRIAKEAEAYLDSVSSLKYIDNETKNTYKDSLRRLEAYAYAIEAQALITAGNIDKALQTAEKAKQLDPQFDKLYQTLKVLGLAVKDKNSLQSNIECILENILQIQPKRRTGGRKSSHIAFM